ncbi:MAG: tetratricopeptide repeat protein, partial [Acidobacteriota bacterium]
RRLDAEPLAKRLRGDLDAIVMKALEPRPDRRYASAAELAGDVERHLASEPIRARPLTTGVLVGKLLRRHRLTVAAAATVALAVLVGTVGTVGGLMRARQAERAAVEEARSAVEARDEADEVVDFLVRLFDASNAQFPESDKPPGEVTALELLARGAERVESDLADQPLVRARLEGTIGDIYRNLGEFDRAHGLHRSAIETLEALDDPPALQLAMSHIHMVRLEAILADHDSAARHLEAALALAQALPEEEGEHLLAEGHDLDGRLREASGDFEGALKAMQRAVEAYGKLDDRFTIGKASSHHNLGVAYFAKRRVEDAESQFRQAIAILEPQVEDTHPRLATHYLGLGAVIADQGRTEEAVAIFETVDRNLRQRLGDDHHERFAVLLNLGSLRRELGQLERAEASLREALALGERALGDEHPHVAMGLFILALTVESLGRDDEARRVHERSLAIREGVLGSEHLEIAESLDQLARLAMRRGDHGLAHRQAQRAFDIQAAKLDPGHRDIGRAAALLGEALWHLGRRGEARERFDEARALFVAGGEPMRDEIADLEARLADLGAA